MVRLGHSSIIHREINLLNIVKVYQCIMSNQNYSRGHYKLQCYLSSVEPYTWSLQGAVNTLTEFPQCGINKVHKKKLKIHSSQYCQPL